MLAKLQLNPLWVEAYQNRLAADPHADDTEKHCYMPRYFCDRMKEMYDAGSLLDWQGLTELKDKSSHNMQGLDSSDIKEQLMLRMSKHVFWLAMRYSNRMRTAWELFEEVIGENVAQWSSLYIGVHEAHHIDYDGAVERLKIFRHQETTEIKSAVKQANKLADTLEKVIKQARDAAVLPPSWWDSDKSKELRELAVNLDELRKSPQLTFKFVESALSNQPSKHNIRDRVRNIAAALYYAGADVEGEAKLHKAIALTAAVLTDLVTPELDDEQISITQEDTGRTIKTAINNNKFSRLA